MAITIVQKSDLAHKKPHAKVALILAGGAITGASFKVGGLKALNDFLVNKKVTDFDMYVGVSAGGLLAVPLAGGVGPEEMLKSLDGSSDVFSQISPFHVYWPNLWEFIERPLSFLYRRMTYIPGIFYDSFFSLPRLWGTLRDGFTRFIHEPNYTHLEAMLRPLAKIVYSERSLPPFSEAIPSGIFDNRKIEKYLRTNMKRNRLPNSFKAFQRKRGNALYIIAMDLDSGERVIFGSDEKNDVTISEAVQASTALPFFYKPARIKGVDYLDGGVRRTTNMDVAIAKGAQLIICYNPFGPYSNNVVLEYLREEDKYVTKNRRLSSMGILMIFNQVFRTIFHTRIRYFIDQMKADSRFKGDIIVIEPKEDDQTFFEMNPFSFWDRAHAAKLGFASVRETIEENWNDVSGILGSYGIKMTREIADIDYEKMMRPTSDDATIMNVLENDNPFPSKHLRLVRHA